MKAKLVSLLTALLLFVPAVSYAKQVSGTAMMIDAEKVILSVPGGTQSVELSAKTKYYHGNGTSEAGAKTEVTPGTKVTIRLGTDGKAAEIHLPTPKKIVEKSATMKAKLLSRDAKLNTIKVQHADIAGIMKASTIDYYVDDAKVADLPADGSRITSTLHKKGDSYWVTNVKKASN